MIRLMVPEIGDEEIQAVVAVLRSGFLVQGAQVRTTAKTGPQPLHELLAIVLARLGVGALPSRPSGVMDPT